MSRSNLFGIACKTCRRRGRKCDRNLPTCRSCSIRGVECEGYVLRWVDAAAQGTLAGKTHTAPDHETNLHLSLDLSTPTKAKLTKSGWLMNSQHPYHQAQIALTAKPLRIHKDSVNSEGSSVHDTNYRAISILRQQNRSILKFVGTVSDDLGGFIKYYAREISEAFYLGHGPVETPYTRHILPMIRSVPSVRCAVAATAACHLANRLEDDQLKRQSLHLRVRATELLRVELESYTDGPDLACLVSMLLLAQLDVRVTHHSVYCAFLTAMGGMLWGLYRI